MRIYFTINQQFGQSKTGQQIKLLYISEGLEHFSKSSLMAAVICGRLTPTPHHVPRDSWFGNLFIEDDTGALPCEVRGSSLAQNHAHKQDKKS